MPDQPEPNPPQDSIKDDVDQLIAQAEALAGDLAEGIGTDEAIEQHREKEFFASETESEASLNLQLARANAALSSTAAQLGTEKADEKPAKPKVTKLPAKKKISLPAKKAKGPDAKVDQIVAATVPTSHVLPERKAKRPDDAPKRIVRMFVWLKPVARPIASTLFPFFEMLNKPFGWVTPTVKIFCGWAALIISVGAVALLFAAVL